MKRMILAALVLGAGCGFAFANTQVRLGLDSAIGINGEPTFGAIHDGFADRSNVLHGLHWEVIHGQVGFGGHALVRFDQQPGITETYQWSMDWDADLFMSVHLAGVGRLFDPFVELGLGSAGRVFLDDRGDGLQLGLLDRWRRLLPRPAGTRRGQGSTNSTHANGSEKSRRTHAHPPWGDHSSSPSSG